LTLTKENLYEKLEAIIKEVLQNNEEKKCLKFLKDCEKLYIDLSKIKEEETTEFYLFDMKLNKLKIKYRNPQDNNMHRLYRLGSFLSLTLTVVYILYSGSDFVSTIKLFVIYFAIAMSGAVLFAITSYIKPDNEVAVKFLMPYIIAFIFISVLFTNGDKPFDFTNKNVLVFVLGYSSELITTIMNKMIKKVEAVFK
jgi:hypothetical protein